MFKSYTTAVRIALSAVVLIVGLYGGKAHAAGFALIEQSVSGLGSAFAGAAAHAEDATTVFFNPAGMTRLQGTQFIAGTHIVIPSAKFKNEGSTHVLQGLTGVPLLGNNGGDAGVAAGVPHVYLTHKLSDRVTVGIGVNVPFGLETDYKDKWVGRYHALNSEVMTMNINPSFAIKVNDHLSIGGGLSFQYINADLSNAIDFGTLDASGFFAPLGIPAGALGLSPQGADGFVDFSGNTWGFGYNIGALYEFNQNTRVGIAYRSQIRQSLDGKADFSRVPAGLAAAPLFKDGDIEADITLPDNLSLSVYHRFNSRLALLADVTWTNWSVFDELRIEFDNPFQPDAVVTTKWDDNFRYSLGLVYMPHEQWTIRTGVAFDETAIPDAEHRTPRIPGADRFWIAAGAGYRLFSNFTIDVGYAHLFVDDPKIGKIPAGEDAVRGGLTGTYDANVNIISAQINWVF